MVLIHEYRIPMPLSKQEYEIGQLYGVARLSAKEGEEMAKKGTSDGESAGGVGRKRISTKTYVLFTDIGTCRWSL